MSDKQRPRIVEVSCQRHQFEPGDRVIVHCKVHLARESQKSIRKTITQWAGCEVEILFVPPDLRIDVVHHRLLPLDATILSSLDPVR